MTRVAPFIAACLVCLACSMTPGLSSLWTALPNVTPLATGVCGALGLAWARHAQLDSGPADDVTLKRALQFLLLKSMSYVVVMAACMYVYEGRNPAASLLCWLVMASAGLDHTVFDPAFAAIQLAATAPLLFGMHRFRQGAELLDAAPGFVLSERLLLVALLALAQAKVRSLRHPTWRFSEPDPWPSAAFFAAGGGIRGPPLI